MSDVYTHPVQGSLRTVDLQVVIIGSISCNSTKLWEPLRLILRKEYDVNTDSVEIRLTNLGYDLERLPRQGRANGDRKSLVKVLSDDISISSNESAKNPPRHATQEKTHSP